jgi:1-acyl-sn-glycerol-3-phosphate acyltransferase
MRWLGGLPVIRSSSLNQVEQTVGHVRSSARMILALSPEGTRRKLPAWRTGFYYVAKGAGVPILPVAFDYSTRTIRILPAFHLSDDVAGDLEALRSHFRPEMAFRPEQY